MMDQVQYYLAKLEFEIDAWDLFAQLSAKDRVIVVDARSASAYEEEHIPGALTVPHRSMTVETVQGFDRTALYVTYCDGIGCNASTKGALNLTRLGLRVKELIGGLDWWRRDGYATAGRHAKGGKQIDCGCSGRCS
jgi:rhodanese-related sulfurtransferase